jgi:hypothetical protein
MSSKHTWRFFRAGGFDQVRLESGADFLALDQLDQKLWVALACPAHGLEFDTRTLALIDTDQDGRIRAPEIIAAAKWTCSCLKNPDDLSRSAAALELSAINDATDEGKQLLASARQILANLGRKDATAITVEDAADTVKIFAQTRFNGDGIIPVDAAPDAADQAVITDIIACAGSDMDRSGQPGVSQARVDQFFADAQAFSDWWKTAESDRVILPLGDATAAAADAVRAVRAKVDDYFTRCRLAAFDPRAAGALNRDEKDYLAFTGKELTVASPDIAALPLAHIEAGRPLPLRDELNPAWAAAMAKLAADAIKPLLGEKSSLTEADWDALTGKLAAYETWSAARVGASVEKLGLKRVREILSGRARETVTALIAKDKALEPEANAIAAVEKLVRFSRDLHRLLNNFVSFRDFYQRKEKAIFQAGTLYLDQRSCDLCLAVEDAGKHSVMAALAGSYLAYCDCTRLPTGEKRQIVAAFTDGDSDNLMVGRNGIFYDRQGQDWDATITRIVENPISVRQAFWSPYKRLARFIQETAAKRAAAADTKSVDSLTQGAATLGAPGAGAPPAAPAKPKIDTGLISALAIGAAGIGGMVGAVLAKFLDLGIFMPLGVLGILLLISGPSMLLAWLKLRQRNLGPLLDANGWAVNSRAKINVPFGRSLTKVAALPPGARRDLVDPFAEESNGGKWFTLVVVLIVVGAAIYLHLNYDFKISPKSGTVVTNSPAGGTNVVTNVVVTTNK